MRRPHVCRLGVVGLGLPVGEVIHQIPCRGPDPRGLARDATSVWIADNGTHLIYQLNGHLGWPDMTPPRKIAVLRIPIALPEEAATATSWRKGP